MTNSPAQEPVDLRDPGISPHRLHELAQTHPEQWDEILSHPNVYPGLAQWIRDRQMHDTGSAGLFGAAEDIEQTRTYESVEDDADEVAEAQASTAASQQAWATPESAGQPATEANATHQEPLGDSQSAGSSQQQPSGYQQPQYGHGQPQGQPVYGQQFVQPRRRRTEVDLQSARTWGLFVAGGAAFLSLFGFVFRPTLANLGIPATTHVAAGGWIVLLLLLGTVALSLLQLLKPSAWLRFFFSLISLGAAFTMIGRSTAIIGFFGMNSTSFSVIWLLFMSLVLLAGTAVFMAPRDDTPTSAGQQHPNAGWQQPDDYRRGGPQQ